jgi:hypothetical protein
MWNNYIKLPIQSLLLGRCEMSPPCGYTTTLLEIPKKGHCQLSVKVWYPVISGHVSLMLLKSWRRIHDVNGGTGLTRLSVVILSW